MTALMIVLFSTPVIAQELKLEDAILKAQSRNKQLKMQKRQIDYAEADVEDTYYNYLNGSDYLFDIVSTNYSQAQVTKDYEIKREAVLKEQIAYDVENKFDTILELEETYQVAKKNLYIQEEKAKHELKKHELGLASKNSVELEKIALETLRKEVQALEQSIDAEYRKLNDTIGGKEDRYDLIKENIFTPLEMKRSLQGQISYSINSDPKIWKDEEIAKLQERLLIVNTENGAPTYAEYQKRKIGYEQGMNAVTLSKENKEQNVKDRYEKLLQLEVQYEKALLSLKEIQKKAEVIKKQYELGMTTSLVVEEIELALMQLESQINSITRQHNQLRTLFEKPYLDLGM